MSIKIITLIENIKDDKGKLINEHGLSLYIEAYGKKILFDTGQTGDFVYNSEKLGVSLNNLDYVLMSHGHYDHTGGFRKLVENSDKKFELILGRSFFNKKYKTVEDGYKFNGNSFDEDFIKENNIGLKYVDESFKIDENMEIFSQFKTSNNFEILNKKFLIKKGNEYISDEFYDEIVLTIKSDKGLIVVVGCSHIGIVNILEHISNETKMPIYAVIGGSHLAQGDKNRINKTIEYLKKKKVSLIRLCHCTGEIAIKELDKSFKSEFKYNNTGNIIEIE